MIHVISCFWNAEPYIGKCIESILSQSDGEYRAHMIDDMSSDGGHEICERMASGDKRFNIVRNKTKKHKLKSMDDLISDEKLMCDEDIIVELDGDDHFAQENVLGNVRKMYRLNPKIAIMNGRYQFPDGSHGYSRFVDIEKMRHEGFKFSHLRSWKVGLWRGVDKRYFVDPENGEYFKIAADMAYGLPMLELAGQERYMHTEQVMVVYNNQNPLNDFKEGSAAGGFLEQGMASFRIRMMNFSKNPNFDETKIEQHIQKEIKERYGGAISR